MGLPLNSKTRADLSVGRIDAPTLVKSQHIWQDEQDEHDVQSGVSAAGKALNAARSALSAKWFTPWNRKR
jgi:hypothetical protein